MTSKFLRQFFRMCSICYRRGCIDASWEGSASQLESFRQSVRQPDTYGTYGGATVKWRQWAYMLSMWYCSPSEMQDMLINMRSNKCTESVYLRIFQEIYLCGVSDYYNTHCEISRQVLMGINNMFLLGGYGQITRVNGKKMLERVIECCYARIDETAKDEACDNIARSSYEGIIRELWISRTSKNKWYD